MILGLGIDICKVDRVEAALAAARPGFREQVFTAVEISACEGRPHSARRYAARFAAKEAVVKALAEAGGRGSYWREIEVVGAGSRVAIRLHGRALAHARDLGARRVLISLGCSPELATATAVLED